ncbi:MAG: integrase [Pseudonocardiales bacterium]|nr:integrase [Pseudonocardiales bacterium]
MYVRAINGRLERRYVYGKTRRETLQKVVELQKQHNDGLPAGPTTLTVERYLQEWLDHIKHHVRPQTYIGYESSVRLHIIPRIGSKKLVRLTVRGVRLMIDNVRDGGMRPRMIQWIHSTLRNALQHTFSEELVTRDVAKSVRIEQPEKITAIEPFTSIEAHTFLLKVQRHRLYALWVIMLMLGLRRSEVCGLHWSDVDLDHGTLRVSRGLQRVNGSLRELPPKTRRSRRTVPLRCCAFGSCARIETAKPRSRSTPTSLGRHTVRVHLNCRHAVGATDSDSDLPRAVRQTRASTGPLT